MTNIIYGIIDKGIVTEMFVNRNDAILKIYGDTQTEAIIEIDSDEVEKLVKKIK